MDRLLGESRVTGVRLSDGCRTSADFVIAGVGILPGTLALAEAAGLAIGAGQDRAQGRTPRTRIWSAGDYASFPRSRPGCGWRSVDNAIDQAEVVAENILGAGLAYEAKPWFWSDQYDCKLQIAGLNGYDNIVTRGPESSVSFWYFKRATCFWPWMQ